MSPCSCGGKPQYRLFGGDRRTYICCDQEKCEAETRPYADKKDAEREWEHDRRFKTSG